MVLSFSAVTSKKHHAKAPRESASLQLNLNLQKFLNLLNLLNLSREATHKVYKVFQWLQSDFRRNAGDAVARADDPVVLSIGQRLGRCRHVCFSKMSVIHDRDHGDSAHGLACDALSGTARRCIFVLYDFQASNQALQHVLQAFFAIKKILFLTLFYDSHYCLMRLMRRKGCSSQRGMGC
ncbi:MAG: hypothetical protein EAZ34_02510 [Polaromonas sp.]|nr:MAG: hypothetical protein EAZ34_02510 [Polaromonas sp.]